MTDKVTIQPKSKPEKTTISISGETSERLEIYCRANGILRKEFVSLALEYFERTGFDLKSNALDYSPLEKIIGELNEVKATMQTSNEGTEAIRQLLQAVREQKQRPKRKVWPQNRPKNYRFFRKKTTDCVTKSKLFRSIRKRHTGNFAGYVMNRKHSGK